MRHVKSSKDNANIMANYLLPLMILTHGKPYVLTLLVLGWFHHHFDIDAKVNAARLLLMTA